MRKTITTAAIAAMLLTASAALAGPTPEQKCQAAKNSAAGKYAACRQSAEKSLVSTGDESKYGISIAKCEMKFADAWQKAIDNATNAGTTCPDDPLAAGDYKSVIDAHSGNIATALGGDGLTAPSTCGNGTIEQGEECDFGTLGGGSCSTATSNAEPNGELACGAGCTFDTSGCLGCPGTLAGGACWVLGAQGGSCLSACTGQGLAYDAATATYAGSGGSNANCLAVAQAMFPFYTSPPYPEPLQVQGTTSSGVGCTVFNLPTLIRDGNPTTSESVDAQLSRICACH